MKKPSGLIAAILLLSAVSFASDVASAAPSAYEFTVTGSDGPLAGVTSVGTFVFDPTIAPEGGLGPTVVQVVSAAVSATARTRISGPLTSSMVLARSCTSPPKIRRISSTAPCH